MDIKKMIEKTTLPIAIVIAAVILGIAFYAVQYSKQQSIEKQQEIQRRQECYDKYRYNTTYYYDEGDDLCKARGGDKTLEEIFQE